MVGLTGLTGLAGLALALALSTQTAPEEQVMLILASGDRVVSVSEAEALLKSSDPSLQSAATLALGTRPSYIPVPGLPNTRERHDWEIRRGVRRPAQAQ